MKLLQFHVEFTENVSLNFKFDNFTREIVNRNDQFFTASTIKLQKTGKH